MHLQLPQRVPHGEIRALDQPFLAGFQELLAPAVIQIGVQAFAATQGSNALLDAQALKDNPDLLFDREPPAGLPPDVLNDLLS